MTMMAGHADDVHFFYKEKKTIMIVKMFRAT
jgi:hypothetical protein